MTANSKLKKPRNNKCTTTNTRKTSLKIEKNKFCERTTK